MDRAPRAVKLRNCTDTFEHVVIERNLARITLRNHIKNAEAMREIELKKRAEEVALEGDEKLAKSRFLVTTVGVPYILTDVAEIQDAVIDHNINHFSEAEDTSLGMGTFLHDAIGPHGTLEFCDRVLDQGLGKADKDDINYVEAYELLQHMQQQKTTINTLTSAMGVDTIRDLLRPDPIQGDNDDSDSESDSEPEVSNPEESWTNPLDQ
eukprot:CAMPEP_0194321104 /NCGR_PEP_ID=MMETSP0171-20130528/17346_1 /TAXON_ID=218684 /ORGANISM="Corethron pennatum, Strain L29A3" /LENGTH=208 /DNA_ID=CAMNT_0039078867 /DNA_START=852 /DNA_END=1479 /DNA_ORIENTATION=+